MSRDPVRHRRKRMNPKKLGAPHPKSQRSTEKARQMEERRSRMANKRLDRALEEGA